MIRTERVGIVMTRDERLVLRQLAERERISEGAVLRRLVWFEGSRAGVVDEPSSAALAKQASEPITHLKPLGDRRKEATC